MPRYYNGINPESENTGGGGGGGSDIVGDITTNGVVYTQTGLLYTESGFGYNPSSNTFSAANITSSGDLTIDTNTLKVDSMNNRVGVLTATPAYPLDVVGSINSSSNYRIGGTIAVSSSALGTGIINSSLTSVGTLASGLNIATGQTYKIASSDVLSATTLGSGVVNSSLTSLGLLTSLGVTGTAIIGGNLSTNANATVTGNLRVDGNITCDTNTFVADSMNNRVGINILSPAYPLDVVGDLNTSTIYRIGGTSVLTSNTLGSGIVNSSLTTIGTLATGLNIATGQTYKINGTNVLSATALGSGVTASSLTSVGTLGSLAVSGGVTVNTNTLVVDTVNNRVGINTTSPLFPLHVTGETTFADSVNFNVYSTTVEKGMYFRGSDGAQFREGGSSRYNLSMTTWDQGVPFSPSFDALSFNAFDGFRFLVASLNTVVINALNIADTNGRVTINAATGLTNTASRFHINETATNLIACRIYNTGTGNCLQIDDEVSDTSLTVIDNAGNMYFGANTLPSASAKVAINSTTQGLLPPRMTTLQKTAISSPAAGLVVYDTNLASLSVYNGTAWSLSNGESYSAFTPTFTNGTTAMSITVIKAEYVKNGSICKFEISFTVTNKNSVTGDMVIRANSLPTPLNSIQYGLVHKNVPFGSYSTTSINNYRFSEIALVGGDVQIYNYNNDYDALNAIVIAVGDQFRVTGVYLTV